MHENYAVHSLQFLSKKILCEQDMRILVASSESMLNGRLGGG